MNPKTSPKTSEYFYRRTDNVFQDKRYLEISRKKIESISSRIGFKGICHSPRQINKISFSSEISQKRNALSLQKRDTQLAKGNNLKIAYPRIGGMRSSIRLSLNPKNEKVKKIWRYVRPNHSSSFNKRRLSECNNALRASLPSSLQQHTSPIENKWRRRVKQRTQAPCVLNTLSAHREPIMLTKINQGVKDTVVKFIPIQTRWRSNIKKCGHMENQQDLGNSRDDRSSILIAFYCRNIEVDHPKTRYDLFRKQWMLGKDEDVNQEKCSLIYGREYSNIDSSNKHTSKENTEHESNILQSNITGNFTFGREHFESNKANYKPQTNDPSKRYDLIK